MSDVSLSELEQVFRDFDVENPMHYLRMEKIFNESPQLKVMGFALDLNNPHEPRGYIDEVREFHRGGVGGRNVNGAIISGLCDLMVGTTGFAFLDRPKIATARVDVRLLRPLAGDRVEARSRVRRVRGNRVFSEVDVMDEKGRVCTRAKGVVVFGIGGGKPAGE